MLLLLRKLLLRALKVSVETDCCCSAPSVVKAQRSSDAQPAQHRAASLEPPSDDSMGESEAHNQNQTGSHQGQAHLQISPEPKSRKQLKPAVPFAGGCICAML